MYAGSKGIYAYGIREEEKHYIYKLLLIDKNLELVFEKEIYRIDKSRFPGKNNFNYLLEQDNKLYLYLRKDFGWDIERFLYCLTLDGEILWKKPFENKIFVRGMTANQDGLYFFGEKGTSHAKVVSYSLDGEQKWEQDFIEEVRFNRGTANNVSFFTFSNSDYDLPRTLYKIGANGERETILSVSDSDFRVKFLETDDKGNPFFVARTYINIKESEWEYQLQLWKVVQE